MICNSAGYERGANVENVITFSGESVRKINFAMQQNYVPIFRSITLKNTSDTDLCAVTVRISFEPDFAKAYESAPMDISSGETVELSPVNIIISPEYLFGLTEKAVGCVTLEAVCGGKTVGKKTENIELLAYDQWTGSSLMPEMIGAFVTPNHPKVRNIVSKASMYMKKWSGDPSFTGYQTCSSNAVKMQMGAVYAALQAENIAYAPPPASYETAQRVRTPDVVLEGGFGTCLDLAVLYCACLECIDLNPILIVIKGHAFAGCWLEEETFPDCIQYDRSALAKRTAKGVDIISVVECTDFTAGKGIDFDTAEVHGVSKLINAEDFEYAVDIKRTRASGIRPIPLRISDGGSFKTADYGKRKKSEITSAPEEIKAVGNIRLNSECGEITKQQIWERKLLDLSLRNSLLNFRYSVSSVKLITADLSRLEDELSGGGEFRLCPAPSDAILQAADDKLFELENDKGHIAAIADEEMKNHRLRTYSTASELERAMAKLRRQAKVSLEENGANTIYLALGFLEWYETDRSEKPRYAPLILVPVNITRKIQDKAYTIKMRDEGVQVNITLLEMLRQNFGIDIQGLSHMPEDEHGVDIPFILTVIRQAVMANSRWDVKELAFIGQFSFSRFIMWNDIRSRSDELVKNKVAASLISGKTEWQGGDISISPNELDSSVLPSDMAVPIAADSSQLAAIYAANSGKSFVLHGPPGTGKSQTITNIIANALYHDQTVLFVAEKMAALEVVENRLNKIGLAPFCLELHSNKSRKRDVLKQLEDVLNISGNGSPAEYAAEAEKISGLRRELNGTAEEIHRLRSYGMSLYDAGIRAEQNSEYGGKFVFSEDILKTASAEKISQWRSELENLAAAGNGFGDVVNTPLKCCKLAVHAPDTRVRLAEKLTEFKSALKALDNEIKLLSDFSGRKRISYRQYTAENELIKIAHADGEIILGILSGDVWERLNETVKQLIKNGREQQRLKSEILAEFEISVLGYDSGKALADWKSAQSSWFIPKLVNSGRLIKELNSHSKELKTVTKQNFPEYCGKLSQLKALTDEVKNIPADVLELFSSCQGLIIGEKTNWEAVGRAVEISEALRDGIRKAPFTAEEKISISRNITNYYGTASSKADISDVTEELFADNSRFGKIISELSEEYELSFDSLESENWQTEAKLQADRVIAALPMLKEWTGIMDICRRLEESGIGNIAEAYLEGRVCANDLLKAFECDLFSGLVSMTISETPVLTKFQGTLFEETIRKYGSELEKFRSLTIQELTAKLSARIPATDDADAELAVLKKAIKSGGRGMSIRRLFESMPKLLRRLCPVMLMSPMSAAQYIDPASPKFDYVIFDEASQLPTCEAVGALSRGENVIIAGDPKQLPPTSFFSASHVDEDNYEKEDLESLLDDCLALSMPSEHLLWHYRSRHESLIAYSNAKYYDNKLYTFPSPDNRISKVTHIAVEGFYDRSNSRTNKAEAQAVTDEIVRRLRDSELRKESIGVVTFSMPQQNLIDDMLDEVYRKEPELEKIADEMYEPIIIKNLENIQGDERDVIMFSIGYGPDKDGKVSMNFGPLNRDGGWRRLNVAISRARKRMLVFSVITSDMIDLAGTRSEGVEGLKGFLKYAEQGGGIAVKAGASRVTAEGFERLVATELKKRGYSADCSVGCSDFKVDIAVAAPSEPNRYILGIFCGTKANFTSSTAEDRYISQRAVLHGLGWETMNIHILDWLDNKEKVMERIENRIKSILDNK